MKHFDHNQSTFLKLNNSPRYSDSELWLKKNQKTKIKNSFISVWFLRNIDKGCSTPAGRFSCLYWKVFFVRPWQTKQEGILIHSDTGG